MDAGRSVIAVRNMLDLEVHDEVDFEFRKSNFQKFFDGKILSLYPNPSTNLLYVKNPHQFIDSKYQVFDVSGRVVLSETFNGLIRINSLLPGSYLLRLPDGKAEYQGKFIKVE